MEVFDGIQHARLRFKPVSFEDKQRGNRTERQKHAYKGSKNLMGGGRGSAGGIARD